MANLSLGSLTYTQLYSFMQGMVNLPLVFAPDGVLILYLLFSMLQ